MTMEQHMSRRKRDLAGDLRTFCKLLVVLAAGIEEVRVWCVRVLVHHGHMWEHTWDLTKSRFIYRTVLEFWVCKFVILSHLIKFNHRKLFQVLMKQQLHLKRESSQKTSFPRISPSNIRLQYKLRGSHFTIVPALWAAGNMGSKRQGSDPATSLWWERLLLHTHTGVCACVHI